MDRPKELVEYRAMAVEYNRLKTQLDKMKPRIREILNEVGDFDDLHLQKVVKTEWHEDVMYDWALKNYPDLVSQMSKIVVDVDKFGELVKIGKIDIKLLPEECSSDKVEWHIKTTKKKKEEDDETN